MSKAKREEFSKGPLRYSFIVDFDEQNKRQEATVTFEQLPEEKHWIRLMHQRRRHGHTEGMAMNNCRTLLMSTD